MSKEYYNIKIPPIKYIIDNNIDFCSGNIIKYASRWNKKGDPIGDLDKIIEYARILKEEVNDHEEAYKPK